MAEESRKKILLVEDDHILSDALSMRLTQSGFNVFKCISGDEAIPKALEIMPDIILLDIILPKVKGTTIIRSLKHDERLSHIPVIMLTNLTPRPSLIDELKDVEPTFFLVKSECTLNEIVEKTREAIALNKGYSE